MNSELQVADIEPVPESELPPMSLRELRQSSSQQTELPFAIIAGKPLTELPKDLYIPPEALEVFLEAFEGPLDLLLYLIKRQNIDILEINVAAITEQYMHYVNMMNSMQFELAAEYLLMAAMLAEIKSRMLLPRSAEEEEEGEDPRAQLIRRLQEYERFKKAAADIDGLPRVSRDIHLPSVELPDLNKTKPEPEVDLKELLVALAEVLRRAQLFESHHVQKEKLSTRERMSEVLARVSPNRFTPFVSLFSAEEGRLGVVVTFLAIMELIKEGMLELVQTENFGPIHVKARSVSVEGSDGEIKGFANFESTGFERANTENTDTKSFDSEEIDTDDVGIERADIEDAGIEGIDIEGSDAEGIDGEGANDVN